MVESCVRENRGEGCGAVGGCELECMLAGVVCVGRQGVAWSG